MDNNNSSNLKAEILKTIIRFDIFRHPLGSYEIHKFLNISCNYSDLLVALDEMSLAKKIFSENGFYCLPQSSQIISERFKRLNYFNAKIKKAIVFTRLISFFPFVKGVFVSNIIGDHNLRKESDIDFFIISSPSSIWITRFFCTFWAKILGLRPNSKTKENKICLSFYISSDNLNLEKYLYNSQDFYFIYWLAGLEPIFFRSSVYQSFWKSNAWLEKYLPNFCFPVFNSDLKIKRNTWLRFDFFVHYFNAVLKKYQLKIMPQQLKEQCGQSSGVVLDDNIIKLFLEDKRPIFIDKFDSMLKSYEEYI